LNFYSIYFNIFLYYFRQVYTCLFLLFLKGSPRQVVKSLLNNLIGRFGLNFIKPITATVNKKELDRILATKEVKTFKEINEENYLITYNPVVNKAICESHNLD